MPARSRLQRLTADAKEALDAGDLLRACDIALEAELGRQGGLRGPDGFELAKLHVLAHARLGDAAHAIELYEAYGLAGFDDLDAQALRPRLAKDAALAAIPTDFAGLRAASRAYLDVYERFHDPYPGVNAASLAALAGDRTAARKIARSLLASERLSRPTGYYDTVTVAEALLVVGRLNDCADFVTRASRLADADIGSRSTTARQLALVARSLGLSAARIDALLAPLKPPAVVAFAGSAAALRATDEATLAATLDAMFDDNRIGIGYGALSRGAEIVMAERLLARGGELDVVLPVLEADFLTRFVGAESHWHNRWRACLDKASTVTVAADAGYVGDPQQLRFGSAVAMGLARLRAQQIGAPAFNLGFWKSRPELAPIAAVTDISVLPDYATEAAAPEATPVVGQRIGHAAQPPPERALKAILFADFPGFSRLAEDVLPAFWEEVMRRIAVVLDRHAGAVACRNTWGDAIYAVIDTARDCAFIALEIVEALSEVNRSALRIHANAGMRIGAHLGAVYVGRDSVTGATNYFGTQVSRAARIEPITPAGAVYVTEQFAAVLALEEPEALACTYVGRLELPKDHGPQRMYRLSRPQSGPAHAAPAVSIARLVVKV